MDGKAVQVLPVLLAASELRRLGASSRAAWSDTQQPRYEMSCDARSIREESFRFFSNALASSHYYANDKYPAIIPLFFFFQFRIRE